MDEEIHFYAVREIKGCQTDALIALGQEAAAYFYDNQPGTLEYEWYIAPGTMDVHLFERYLDADACMEHLKAWGELFAERANELLDPKSMFVFGKVTDEIKAALAGVSPVYCGDRIAGYPPGARPISTIS